MHMLVAQPGGFVEDDSIIMRLDQTPADLVILSAADTTLALLAAQHPRVSGDSILQDYPEVRLANYLHLRQHASIDLYIDQVLQHAKVIVIDHLGGESYWPYGTERIVELCRSSGINLLMFSGDNTEDPNLLHKSTVSMDICRQCWRFLREGGPDNAQQLYRYLAQQFFGRDISVLPPKPIPAITIFHPHKSLATVDDWQKDWHDTNITIAIVFYRSHLQAGNTEAFHALCDELLQQGFNPLPVALSSLKDDLCLITLRQLCREYNAQLVLNTTAFALSSVDSEGKPQQALVGDLPVLQLIMSGDNRQRWEADARGLRPRDIAMHVALPEVDGRIVSRAISFKGLNYHCNQTQTDVIQYQPHRERIAYVVKLAARLCRLRTKVNKEKRLALILANYPTREGRLGNGVGLDTPASIIAILHALKQQGYLIKNLPHDGDSLMRTLQQGVTNDSDYWAMRPAFQSLAMADYMNFFEQLPKVSCEAVNARWGPPERDPMMRQNRFMISGLRCGQLFIGIQPARGYHLDPKASYHDPDLIPPHSYLAFYCWLCDNFQCDAIVHVGKHGSLEWLPGKSVALSEKCWPDLIFGPMPHLYPFIVNDPGEGTQAKRRIQAVIVDHLMPPLTRAENYGQLQDLERLLDEFYEARTLDSQRESLLRKDILECILKQDLHRDLDISRPQNEVEEMQLLNCTDAYLCELKESQIRNGLHIFGHSPEGQLASDTLVALARYPVNRGEGRDNSLIRALAEDLLYKGDTEDDEKFDPLDADWQQSWQGARPDCLQKLSEEPWRNHGDTRERLEWMALHILQQQVSPNTLRKEGLLATALVMARVYDDLQPRLTACGEQEIYQLMQGLSGRFVPPGPSGAPSRGRPDVLPTGKNFFSVDTRAIPTHASWTLGWRSAELLVEKYLLEEGNYPSAIGLSVWGTSTMRTGGDDIAQAFALIGVKPKWAEGSYRVTDFEILTLGFLDRPRIDVTLRVSGFFRDAFQGLIHLFDGAVQAVAKLDEPAEMNPIRDRIQRETKSLVEQGYEIDQARQLAGYRIFGAKPGAYGAGLQGLIDSGKWKDDQDLARAYRNWGGYAYSQESYGEDARDCFSARLSQVELVVQNQDNREHDLLDSDDYYQFQGGMAAAIRHYGGQQPTIYFGDHSNPQAPKVRSLELEISRVMRSRVTNPKWIDGVKRHGYKGAFEMAATVDYLFAYDATARVVRDDQYAQLADAYLHNADRRAFLQQHNPAALHDICERLLEAIQRGLWQQPMDHQKRIEEYLLSNEQQMEG
ncbi:MAG: cobaltochelatase subunit CobN [Gammaproteobacteria bacterium]|nr:cobaltochelatase subunit CobN [Gammaproteobacteria bacterium]